MTTVTSTTSATTTTDATTSSASATVISDYQTFLQLMTTQLQNQDPTDPMDSSDYAVQLATFSQVEQQVRTNDLLSALSEQLGVSGLGQYADWVGMEALATTSATFDGESAITLSLDAASGADQAVLVVKNASGTVVDSQEVSVSAETLDWSGETASGTTLSAGTYSFALESYSNGSLLSTADVAVYGKVTEVQEGDTGTVLVMASGETVSVDEVAALRAAE